MILGIKAGPPWLIEMLPISLALLRTETQINDGWSRRTGDGGDEEDNDAIRPVQTRQPASAYEEKASFHQQEEKIRVVFSSGGIDCIIPHQSMAAN